MVVMASRPWPKSRIGVAVQWGGTQVLILRFQQHESGVRCFTWNFHHPCQAARLPVVANPPSCCA